ncbi:MAG: glycosyltransferase family 9 protein [Verrucomicrobia bacterium]|nr:glycosyltransferase family 9 protein [Verrucomicrobiota bacterium]
MQIRGKILVIRGGAIGDFILTLPVLSALRDNFSGTELHVLGYPKVAELALSGGLADRVRSIEAQALAGFFARNGDLSVELAEYFSTFNIIISFLYDPDEVFQTNVRRCSSGQFIQGPHRPRDDEDMHATDVFLKPLERLAVFASDPAPRLTLNATDPSMNEIAFHPGSGSEKKNWPENKWSDLLKRFSNETDFKLLMIGGEAEGERLTRLQKRVPSQRLELAANLPLTKLAQRLASSSFFLGHDSGITHLAGAIGLRGVVLWGPSNEKIWQPRSAKMTLLRGSPDLHELSVNEVFDRVRSDMN